MVFKSVLQHLGTFLIAFSVYIICEQSGIDELAHTNDWTGLPMLYVGTALLAISTVMGRKRNDG